MWALGFRAKGFRVFGVWGCSSFGFRVQGLKVEGLGLTEFRFK